MQCKPDEVACTYNPTTLETEFGNSASLIPVVGNSPTKVGQIV